MFLTAIIECIAIFVIDIIDVVIIVIVNIIIVVCVGNVEVRGVIVVVRVSG